MTRWDDYDDDDKVTRLPVPLRIRKARQRDPTEIPPRQWLYGTLMLRKYVSMLVAPGGTGKSSLALAFALDLASGKGLFGFHIFQRVPVWYLNLEDDDDEIDRRIAALRLVHQIGWDEIDDYFFTHAGRERQVCMAKIDPDDGSTIIFPDREAILAEARIADVGVIVVDPFIKSHQLDENSNPQMDAAVGAWTAIGDEIGCSVFLVQHTRKGTVADIQAARGAKALSDACRVACLLTAMEEHDAKAVGIAKEDMHRYIRLDNAKANMSSAGRAAWFELIDQGLGNGNIVYPAGDTVSAVKRWNLPTPWDALDPTATNNVFVQLMAGPGDGEQYTLARKGRDTSRWAGNVLIKVAGVTTAQASAILDQWIANNVLEANEYRSKGQRRMRMGISYNANKINQITAGSRQCVI